MYSEVAGVYLMGLRAAGKTSLGEALAKRLGFAFLDTDRLLEERSGKAVSAILEEDGEAELRRQERDLMDDLTGAFEAGRRVVALGGGTVEAPGVEDLLYGLRDHLGWRGVHLLVAPRILARRMRRSPVARPRLVGRTVEEEIRILTSRRVPLFERLADVTFDNSPDDLEAQLGRLHERLLDHAT